MNSRREVVPIRQLIYAGAASFPDELDLVTDLPMPRDWTPDDERTAFLRDIGMSVKDTAAWNREHPEYGALLLQVYFRSWNGYDLAFELFGDDFSRYSSQDYNAAVQSVLDELLALDGSPYEAADLQLTPSSEVRIDLSGLTYPTLWGERKPFGSTHYTVRDFVSTIRAEWLEFVECHKCGQSRICIYPVQRPERLREEDFCDVALLGLETTVSQSWEHLTKEQDFQSAIDALFRAVRFLAEARYAVGALVSEPYQEWLGNWQPSVVLSGPLYLRDELNGLSSALAKLEVGHKPRAILVEGESEHAFLTAQMDHGQLSGSEIVAYKGRGNLKNIKMLVASFQERGYQVFLQGDLDGADPSSRAKRDFIETFRAVGVEPFMFRYDFESAFPRPLLVYVAAKLADRDPKEVAEMATGHDCVAGVLEELGLSGRKPELARHLERAWHYYHDPDARKSEIHKWLRSFYGKATE